jgi:hypothetical protein
MYKKPAVWAENSLKLYNTTFAPILYSQKRWEVEMLLKNKMELLKVLSSTIMTNERKRQKNSCLLLQVQIVEFTNVNIGTLITLEWWCFFLVR